MRQNMTKNETNCNKPPKLEYINGEGYSKEDVMSSKYPEILTLQQAADMLQISERTIQRMLKTGEIPGAQIGGQWRFDREQLRAMVRGEWQSEPDQVELAERESLVLGVEIPQAFLDLQQAAKKRLSDHEREDDDDDH
jgi:excisionase family DNA binding protein